MARAHEEIGVVVVDDDEGEVPFELSERAPHRLGEVAVVVALDQVRHGLRVGLRPEGVAVRDQLAAQLAEVLDDPVQDDRELVGVAPGERVRVRLGDAAVRRPARVAETVARMRPVRPRCLLQALKVADGAHVVEPVLLAQRDTRRVVAPVLEALEPLEQQRLRLTRSHVTDDPAHPEAPLSDSSG